MSKNQKPIIGGIFGTHTEVDADGNITKKDDFHLRIYWDLFYSGAIKKLKGNMFQVYIAIAMHLDNRGKGWPTQENLAELLGLSRNTVGTAVKQLEKEGFITREKIRTSGKFDNTIYKIKSAPSKTEKAPEKTEEDHAQKLGTDHDQKLGTEETPENQGSNHAQKLGTVTMPNSSAPSFQHEELGTKEELSLKKDPSLKKDLDDDAERISNPWESDSLYMAFREMFTKTGADDIKKHDEHYQKFVDACDAIGFGSLIIAAEKYIKSEGKKAQIIYFLSGHYNQYITKNKLAKKSNEASKKAETEIRKAQLEAAAANMTDEELQGTYEDIHASMAELQALRMRETS